MTTTHQKIIGDLGENYAEQFLTTQNYQIIKKKYYTRYGEIDLIATKNNTLIFIEVKTRISTSFGHPQESITPKKLQKIQKTALHFLNTTKKKLPKIWRIHAIFVKLKTSGELESIQHLKNIN